MRGVVTIAAVLAAVPGGAAAQPAPGVAFEWTRGTGAEQCADRDELAARIEERLGRRVFGSPTPAAVIVSGQVGRAPVPPRWRGSLQITQAGRTAETREITSDATSCRPLGNAITLVLSLLLDPLVPTATPPPPPAAPAPPNPGAPTDPGDPAGAPSPTPAAPDNPAAPDLNPGRRGAGAGPGLAGGVDLNPGEVGGGGDDPGRRGAGAGPGLAGGVDLNPGEVGGGGDGRVNRVGNRGGRVGGRWRGEVALGTVGQVGALPGVAGGPRVAGRVRVPLGLAVGVELQVLALFGAEASTPDGRAAFSAVLAGLALCPELLAVADRLSSGVCASFDAGTLLVRGEGFVEPHQPRRSYGQVGASGWLSLRIYRWLRAGASLGAVAPIRIDTFTFEDDAGVAHVLYRTGALAGQAEIHAAVEIR